MHTPPPTALSQRMTIRQQLFALNGLITLVLFGFGTLCWQAMNQLDQAAATLQNIGDATRAFQDADMMHDAIRADILGVQNCGVDCMSTAGADLERHIQRFELDLERTRASWNAVNSEALPDPQTLTLNYAHQARQIIQHISGHPDEPIVGMSDFLQSFSTLEDELGTITDAHLAPAAQAAAQEAENVRTLVRTELSMGFLLTTGLIAATFYFFGNGLSRRMKAVVHAAEAIGEGDLSQRVVEVGQSELGALGRAFNEMADNLKQVADRREQDAQRAQFGSQLSDALDVADSHGETIEIVERAMDIMQYPGELLLADSSQAHMERAASHPRLGAPGCGVESPWSCVAVRRASSVTFSDSEALNACPRLRGRPGGACSAACVPVSFMGRAMGVLHISGPQGAPPSTETLDKMRTLATQAGTRLGTIRMMEKTRLQASTDGLTGLLNRRAAENRVHEMVARGQSYALALADLDHFKRLNDTFGHDAGDRALRRFSQIMGECVRSNDVCARFGGEEFLLIFPNTSVEHAAHVLERIRNTLKDPSTQGKAPAVTASFGLVHVQPGESMDEAVRRADAALYHAKEAGRDRVVLGNGERQVTRVAEEPYGNDFSVQAK